MSGDAWILAVDLGNGGPKVAAVTPGGEVLGTAMGPVSVEIGTDGTATQNADEWWTQLGSAVREVVAGTGVAPAGLHAVGITGQWGSTVPVDAQGRPTGPVLLWADTRAAKYAKEIVGGPLSVQGFAPHKVLPFVRLTGGAPSPNGADPTGHSLLLQRELTDVYARTVWLLEPVDYVGMRLTGRAAATRASMILSWLTDNHVGATGGYEPSLVARARRDPRRLPELLPTSSVLGPLLPDVAEELGLRAGAPVVCGIPDLHAAVLASGAVAPFESHLAISTTAWLGARVPFKRTDVLHSMATVPGLDPHHPIVANNQNVGASALQWLREQIISPPDGLLGGGSGVGASGAAPEMVDPTFEEIVALAESVPAGSEGLVFTPWLNGERSPVEDDRLRGAFLNLSLRSNRSMMVRAVLEGVALNVNWLLGYYEKFLKRPVPWLRIIGGGAQSDLWCQIHADVLDRPIEQVLDPRSAQLRGVAMWARVVLGEITLEDVPALVPVARRFEPDAANRAVYATMAKEYKGLASRLSPVGKALSPR